jgi:hypothetical protein
MICRVTAAPRRIQNQTIFGIGHELNNRPESLLGTLVQVVVLLHKLLQLALNVAELAGWELILI